MIESLLVIDWITVSLLIIFGITGFFNGLMKEIFSAAAWIFSLIIAWYYGPLLFPLMISYIETEQIMKAVSFLLLFISFFVAFKFMGSFLSKLTGAIGLKSIDRIFGFFFGAIKVSAILTSLFLYNLEFLDQKKWWLDSQTREYALLFSEIADPIISEWRSDAEILMNKDNLKLPL